MVNLALLVIILILVIYCLVNNKENFEGWSVYPFTQPHSFLKDVTPLSQSDIFSTEKRNENDKVILDEKGVPVTKQVTRGDFVKTDAGSYTDCNSTSDEDSGTPKMESGHLKIIGPSDGLPDDKQLCEYRENKKQTYNAASRVREGWGHRRSPYNNGSTPNSGETLYEIYEKVKCLIDARESTSELEFINKINQC